MVVLILHLNSVLVAVHCVMVKWMNQVGKKQKETMDVVWLINLVIYVNIELNSNKFILLLVTQNI